MAIRLKVLDDNICLKINSTNDNTNYCTGEFIPVIARGADDHSILKNRDLDDQHTINAITGLQDALDSKIGIGDTLLLYCGTATEVI